MLTYVIFLYIAIIVYKIMKKTADDPQIIPMSCSLVIPFRLEILIIIFVDIIICNLSIII